MSNGLALCKESEAALFLGLAWSSFLPLLAPAKQVTERPDADKSCLP